MRLVVYANDNWEAARVLGLLRNNGIATYSKAAGSPWIGPTRIAIFVHFDGQYDDAVALLRNPRHVVRNPIDIERFENASDAQSVAPILRWSVTALAVVVLFIIALLYWLDKPLF